MAKGVSSLLKMIPSPIRLYPRDVSAAAMWGFAAAAGAIWLVQPFDWLKQQLAGKPEEEQEQEQKA